ncbi:MAG: SUMF1/EgtB/PvdO family nonheme iron enzyme [Verrucomicrobia bacterium]|nr:SUMF1/EgtB/PvdO family nonheme iron enzyme [Verrucomicrobiota bacterium]
MDRAPQYGMVNGRRSVHFGRVDKANWKDPQFDAPPQDNHPVCCVSWDDAVAFCEWLTERERKAGRLASGLVVRLPTEAEWEYACRAGTQTRFWWGENKEDGKGRLNWAGKDDGFEFAAPADSYGERGRNVFGLADMLGNVQEWCLDEYDATQAHEERYRGDPNNRVLRGGAFSISSPAVRCAARQCESRSSSSYCNGFRVVIGMNLSAATTATASTSLAPALKQAEVQAPAETRVPALTANPKRGEVSTMALGGGATLELVGIPPGEFMLGSTQEEQAWAAQNGSSKNIVSQEGDQPRKTMIKEGFWLGRTEVTVGQWKEFVTATGYKTDAEKKGYVDYALLTKGQPGSRGDGLSWRDPGFGEPPRDTHPVCCVSWNDAVAFCEWLTERERKAGRLTHGHAVRLPTEAEWEYACRAGTQTKFWWGESSEDGKDRLNWGGKEDGFEYVAPVDSYGERGRNGFGLADMLGNVYEWCLDEFDAKQAHEECYKGDPRARVLRGGAFYYGPGIDRCAFRHKNPPDRSVSFNGFRVAMGIVR